LDTAPDHRFLSGLTTHELGVRVLTFSEKLVSLIQFLLRQSRIDLLRPHKFGFLSLGQCAAGITNETSGEEVRSNRAEVETPTGANTHRTKGTTETPRQVIDTAA
jgi:hypothetical protein